MFLLSNTSIKHYIMIITFITCIPPAHADEVLQLKTVLSQTLQHNRQLLAASKLVEVDKTAIDVAQGKGMPRIDMSVGWNYNNDPLQVFGSKLLQQSVTSADLATNTLNHPSFRQNYQTRLGLSLPLFTGGALQAVEDQASARAEASSLMLDFQKQQIIYQTIATYLQARQAWDQLQVSKKSVAAARQRWQDVQSLKNKGMAIVSDVMHAHVYMLQRQLNVDQANVNYQNQCEQLSMLMGSNKDIHASTLVSPSLHFLAVSLQQLLTHAIQNRADYQALEQRLIETKAMKKQANATDYPEINLMAAQTWNSVNPNLQHSNSMIGVTVSMNVFNGGQDKNQQQIAILHHESVAWQLQDKQQSIQHEIKQAYRAVKLAEKSLQRQQEAGKQTQEALRIQSLRYQQGLETTSNLLDAQLSWDTSQVAVIKARYDGVLAKTALLLASGLLNEGVIE